MNDNLLFVKKNWKIFPLNIIYATSSTNDLLIKEEDRIYLYSIHRIENVKLQSIDLGLQFFNIYKVISKELGAIIGYVFNIIPNDEIIIRYTPLCLVVTTPSCTIETVNCAERNVIFKDTIYVVTLSCNAEMITILPTLLGIYPV